MRPTVATTSALTLLRKLLRMMFTMHSPVEVVQARKRPRS